MDGFAVSNHACAVFVQACSCGPTALVCIQPACLLARRPLSRPKTACCMRCATGVNEALAAALLVPPVGRDDASRRCGMRL